MILRRIFVEYINSIRISMIGYSRTMIVLLITILSWSSSTAQNNTIMLDVHPFLKLGAGVSYETQMIGGLSFQIGIRHQQLCDVLSFNYGSFDELINNFNICHNRSQYRKYYDPFQISIIKNPARVSIAYTSLQYYILNKGRHRLGLGGGVKMARLSNFSENYRINYKIAYSTYPESDNELTSFISAQYRFAISSKINFGLNFHYDIENNRYDIRNPYNDNTYLYIGYNF